MKTAAEFVAACGWLDTPQTVGAIAARDAEHAALFANELQRHATESKAREEAMQATIGRLGKEVIDLSEERDRLKGELAEARDRARMMSELIARIESSYFDYRHALAAPSPAESTPKIRDSLAGQMHEPLRFQDLVQRVGPLPTTQLAGAAESTGVVGMLCAFCDGHGRVPPLHNSTCNLCRGTGLQQPAAPPDDIRERLERIEKWAAKVEVFLKHEFNPVEPAAPAAPQEQAGHAFTMVAKHEYNRELDACQCGLRRDNPIHTGAKP